MAFGQQQQIDFSTFNDEAIKQHLTSRNLSTEGDRDVLVARLEEEVNKAWSQYYAAEPMYPFPFGMYRPPQPLAPKKKKKKKNNKRKRSNLTEEEKTKMEEERVAARERKATRKAENRKKMEEAYEAAKERKRLKKEASATKQAGMEIQQKEAKEKRQRSEVFVYFDMKAFSNQLKKALDPKGKKINACNYDFSHKGFRVRFNDPAHASSCAQGATMNDPRTVKVPTNLQVLPAPVESHCVFFLDPCHPGNPEREAAFEWVKEQGIETRTSDVQTLSLWKGATEIKCARYGAIVNIYRERGFIVVQFQSEAAAEAMYDALHEGQKLNKVSMLFMKKGTPKKRDRIECDEKYPKAPKTKKKKVKTVKPEATN